MDELSDADLIQRAQSGYINAVGQLYERHHQPIFRYIWARVYDQRLAEDLTGEVFVRMVKALPTYRLSKIPFRVWLYRIAHNLLIDYHRKEDGKELVPLYQAEGVNMETHNPSTTVEQRLTLEQVHTALTHLDAPQRNVVVLRFLNGLSLRETAEVLGKSIAAVKGLQHRGLHALRTALQTE